MTRKAICACLKCNGKTIAWETMRKHMRKQREEAAILADTELPPSLTPFPPLSPPAASNTPPPSSPFPPPSLPYPSDEDMSLLPLISDDDYPGLDLPLPELGKNLGG